MTLKTEKLLNGLAKALYEKKALLLTGTTGVGKTYLAKKLAAKLKEKDYSCFPLSMEQNVNLEIISCHGGVTYEDIVGGISIGTEKSKLTFCYQDKILIETIANAARDYHLKKGTRYVLIFDDIQRNEISSLLGDAINAIGTEGKIEKIHLNSGKSVEITPNFYFIGTYNFSEIGAVPLPYDFEKKIYVNEVLSDIRYISDDMNSVNSIFFNKVRELVFSHLDMQYRLSSYEQNKYLPGHGYFEGENVSLRIKYQLLPALKQYIKEGILNQSAGELIHLLEVECNKKNMTTSKKRSWKSFSGYKYGVTPERFIEEDATRKCSSIPIENLVGRIIEQKLLSEDEIKSRILFSSKVCYREMEVQGVTYLAALIADGIQHEKIRRSGKPTERCLYNGGTICVDGSEHYFTGGSHPMDYVKDACWRNQEKYRLGESFGSNLVIFRILWQYYQALIDDYLLYISLNPEDVEKHKLCEFIQNEWNYFFDEFKKINPEPVDKRIKGWKNIEAGYNRQANDKVRILISRLTILWKNPGDVIHLTDGTDLILEGVDIKMNDSIYQEYFDAMETLGIRQMILQGPPGTSKTYSAKAFLRYMAGNCSEEELADLQIADYSKKNYCKKMEDGTEPPKLAWDLVQFHPSYGYEDFIRGIKVSTKDGSDAIVYETVNKVLGNMAKLAAENLTTPFYLIIDEINRANLATVFGELIYGLEYRSEKVATPYEVEKDCRISLPANLYIIGTMNTADKSIGGIDYAIRRRFLFFEQLPDENVIKTYNANAGNNQLELNQKACNLFNKIKKLFDDEYLSPEYRKEDVQIGHTYFLADSEDKLRRRFEYQIIPMLKEYYKDGIISFDADEGNTGFVGLLNCISGKICMADQKEDIDKIFENLTA